MSLDTCKLPPSNHLLFVTLDNNGFTPQFVGTELRVVEGTFPPTLTVPDSPIRAIGGDLVEFEVLAEILIRA